VLGSTFFSQARRSHCVGLWRQQNQRTICHHQLCVAIPAFRRWSALVWWSSPLRSAQCALHCASAQRQHCQQRESAPVQLERITNMKIRHHPLGNRYARLCPPPARQDRRHTRPRPSMKFCTPLGTNFMRMLVSNATTSNTTSTINVVRSELVSQGKRMVIGSPPRTTCGSGTSGQKKPTIVRRVTTTIDQKKTGRVRRKIANPGNRSRL
jgi:hypothetical protein